MTTSTATHTLDVPGATLHCTALALAQSHPRTVHTVVAHEPPLADLLPDRDALAAGTDEMIATYLAGDPARRVAGVPRPGRHRPARGRARGDVRRRARPAAGGRRAPVVRPRRAVRRTAVVGDPPAGLAVAGVRPLSCPQWTGRGRSVAQSQPRRLKTR